MKILHFDYDDLSNPYAGGGQAKATKHIFTRLAKRHSVEVVTGNYSGAQNKTVSRVTYTRLGIGGFGNKVSILSFWFLIPLYAFFKGQKVDIISEFFTAPFSVSLTPFATRKVVIATTSFFNPGALANKYKLPFTWVMKLLIRRYRFFIVQSKQVGKKVKRLNSSAHFAIIPRGIEKEFFRTKPVDGDYVLCIGRIDIYNKCLDMLIKSWASLGKEKKGLSLFIAGEGPEASKRILKELCRRYNVEQEVQFLGAVHGPEKIRLYSRARVVIVPSRFETFSNVALETLASAKALVCFDIQGLKWIPENISFKAKKISERHLTQTLSDCLKNKTQRRVRGQKGRMFARQFDWDTVASDYESYFLKAFMARRQYEVIKAMEEARI